jgi:hypothetical protein
MDREELMKELAEALYNCISIVYDRTALKGHGDFIPWNNLTQEGADYYKAIAAEVAARFSFQPLCRMTVSVDPEWDFENNNFKGMSIV